MKPEFKVEGDKVIVKVAHSVGLDKDGDGEMSLKGTFALDLEIDGSEVIEELVKSSALVAKLKEKLGL